jgi:5-methylcytosine-specific restriction endonuclease McrA
MSLGAGLTGYAGHAKRVYDRSRHVPTSNRVRRPYALPHEENVCRDCGTDITARRASLSEKKKTRLCVSCDTGRRSKERALNVDRDNATGRLAARRHYRRHRVKLLADIAAKRRADPEKARARDRAYWYKNHENAAVWQQRRRARWAGIEDTLTEQQWLEMIDVFDRRCGYCGRYLHSVTVDHVVPISAGGANSVDNVIPACKPCNSRKGPRGILKMANEPFVPNESYSSRRRTTGK